MTSTAGRTRSGTPGEGRVHLHTLMTGLVFGESPRWGPDGRLWLADWGAQQVVAVDLEGKSDVMVRLHFPSFQPICIDWLPDGRLLIVSASDRRSEEHTSELQSLAYLVCRLLLEKKKKKRVRELAERRLSPPAVHY